MKSLKQLLAWAKRDLHGLLLWVIELQEELQRLKDLLAQNSQNSSRPPSSDRTQRDRQPKTPDLPPTPKSLRVKSGRKPGGQRGHPGRTLEFCDQPTGWLRHDFLSSYLGFDNCLHTFCKSHLLRELVFLFEEHRQVWAGKLHDLFLQMLQRVKPRKASVVFIK
jgi:hypothetical protein